MKVGTDKLYQVIIDRVLDTLEGINRIASVKELTETIKICLAGRLSKQRNGEMVKLVDIPPDDPGFDGSVFIKSYAEKWLESQAKNLRNKT